MKRANFESRQQNGRLLKQVGKQVSIDRVFDHFQGVLVYVDQFGFCAGLIMGFCLLVSSIMQAAHSWTEKGVI
jgi:hypothetical protein